MNSLVLPPFFADVLGNRMPGLGELGFDFAGQPSKLEPGGNPI